MAKALSPLLIAAISAVLGMMNPAGLAADEPPEANSPVVRDSEDGDELPEDFEPGFWPTAAAVVPGVVAHGAGLWAAGDPSGAYELLRIQAVGAAGATLGLLGVYGTGASRRTISLIYYPTIIGAAGLVVPWFADLYGASVGGRNDGARGDLAPVEARAGYAYIYDPLFDYANFAYGRAQLRLEPFRLAPSAWLALDDDNRRLRLEIDSRLFGPRTDAPKSPGDGSSLDVESAVTYHSFGTDNFNQMVLEAGLAGRYDMRRLTPALRGSFSELSIGLGTQLHGYGVEGAELGEDVSALLLMRVAYGVYFGPNEGRYGEASLYYDHRHDNFAAGSALDTTIDGLFGHVGFEGFYYPFERWGAFTDVRLGSAYVALAGVTFRYGGQ